LFDLSPNAIERIRPKSGELASSASRMKKLHGSRNLRRIRVGDYRVVYTVNYPARAIDVTPIAHRREAYD
jgi:mRNA-degrading endonuclease RelE of RelBE toxin-antitoxin system